MKPYHQQPGVTLYHGNCVDVIEQLITDGQANFDLTFADPPFNIGQGYSGYHDQVDGQRFAAFTVYWFQNCWFASAKGLLAVHCPDDIAIVLLQQRHPPLLHWINWHYRFAQAKRPATAKSCINCREHLLVFGVDRNRTTFNSPLVPTDRALHYNDKRTKKTSSPGIRVAFNIWGLPEDGEHWGRVQGNNAERWCKAAGAPVDHPNQLPEVYVRRVLETFSNPGDRVLVPFAGSGTELVVGDALDREMVGIEIDKTACRSIVKRLKKGSVRVQ